MRKVGRFELREKLGQGGMGAVFLARDQASGREVALKLLHGLAGPAERERFLREGQAAARLRHPGVVTVHEVGVDQGQVYLVMERVEGVTLRRALEQAGLFEPDRVRALGADLADALAVAHAAGVVHRDLKPENVLLDGAGRARLSDFGLARLVEAEARALTRTGELLGTPGYMAPEQVRGERAGPPADVFALGVLLYELLAGRRPHQGVGLPALLEAVAAGRAVPLRTFRPDVDPELERVIMRCLQVAPADRPQAAALARDLRHVGGQPRGLLVAGVITLGLACLGLLGASQVLWPAGPAAPGPRPLPVADPAEAPPPPSAVADRAPAWFGALPVADRPPWPLRPGLRCSSSAGIYLWALPDGTDLQLGWVADPAGPGCFLSREEISWAQLRTWLQAGDQRSRLAELAQTHQGRSERSGARSVGWDEAQAWCAWAGLRLPTRAEWRRGLPMSASGDLKEWVQDPLPEPRPASLRPLPGNMLLAERFPALGRLTCGQVHERQLLLEGLDGDMYAVFDVSNCLLVGFRAALDPRGERPRATIEPWYVVAAQVAVGPGDPFPHASAEPLLARAALRLSVPPQQLALEWPDRRDAIYDRRGLARPLEAAGLRSEGLLLRATTRAELPAGSWALFVHGCSGLRVALDGRPVATVDADTGGDGFYRRWEVSPAQAPLRVQVQVELHHLRGHAPRLVAMILPEGELP